MSPVGSSIRVETITISASSGSSFQTPRHVCGGTRIASCFADLDDLVAELELQLAGEDEVDLLLRLVPVAVRALAARVLRHPPVRDRNLLGADRVGDPAHLARVVAEPVVDVLELDDLVVAHSRLPWCWRISNTTGAECSGAGIRSGRIDVRPSAAVGRNRLVLVACILGSVIVFVDSTVVNVALPAIQRDLGGGLALQQWVVDAYLLTLGSLLLVGGSLGDLFGARRLFLIGIVALRRSRRSSAPPRPTGRR